MRLRRLAELVVPAFAIVLGACADAESAAPPNGDAAPTPVMIAAPIDDGVTLSTATKERLTGAYVANGVTIHFDLAKVGDDVFADVTGDGNRPIVHLETSGDVYTFRYMGGGLTLRTTKAFIAAAREQAATQPDAVSTDGFAFTGDTHLLDDMLKLPEMAELPALSRALGVRGFTGSEYPASLVLHKMGRQSADALGIRLAPLDAPTSTNGYCTSYPNRGDSCYGMCGPGCSCWSWVCGDCCYHHGCAVHDSWCRQGKWYFCYNITAVIALFGC